jgi:hypothetical protein
MPCEVVAHLAPAYPYEKSHREQSRAGRYHDKEEDYSSPKILLLSTGAQCPLRRDQDCQPRRSEDAKGKRIPSRNYVGWKTHLVPQRKENGSTGDAAQNHPMPRIVASNQIDQVHRTLTH